MACKGICEKYKSTTKKFGSRYQDGTKRCNSCDIYLKWDESSRCPCCGAVLRTKPRDSKNREAFRTIQQQVKRI